MSGGVDSSVAAALLAEQGHDVIGVSMQLYDQTEGQTGFGTCCTIDDLHDARRVAAAIGIPHYILNFESRFDEQVVSNFIREYAAGRTPIPCAHCNSDVKFATLLDRARGIRRRRAGHRSLRARRTRADSGRFVLRRGADPAKDQSYFLFSLTQEQLARACFPVGHLDKDVVRDQARRLNLRVASKPDSQEICFVPDGDYAAFIERAAPELRKSGAIVGARRRAARHAWWHASLYDRPAQGPWPVVDRAAVRLGDSTRLVRDRGWPTRGAWPRDVYRRRR